MQVAAAGDAVDQPDVEPHRARARLAAKIAEAALRGIVRIRPSKRDRGRVKSCLQRHLRG